MYKLLQGPIVNTEGASSTAGGEFGYRVAISNNKKVLVVGANEDYNDAGDMVVGAAYVYRNTLKGYVFSQRIQPAELTNGAKFGEEVRCHSSDLLVSDRIIRTLPSFLFLILET